VAVDGVTGGFLGDGGLTVLLELTDDLLADERAERRGAAKDVGAGVVDGGEDEGGGVDRSDGVGEEGGAGALRGRGSGGAGGGRCGVLGDACGVWLEAAWIEVGDVQIRVVEAPRKIGICLGGGLVGSLRERRDTDEKKDK